MDEAGIDKSFVKAGEDKVAPRFEALPVSSGLTFTRPGLAFEVF